MITLDQFKEKYLKLGRVEFHSYGTDPSTFYQCVDLINAYINEVLDNNTKDYTEIIGANAVGFITKYDKEDFEWIKNTPNSIPKRGDIVIFSGGVAGHTSIVLEATISLIKSLDQNFSVIQRITLETHNYSKVLGWLHPKNSPQVNTEPLNDKKKALEIEKDELEIKVTKLETQVTSLKNDVIDRKDKITELEDTIKKQNIQIVGLTGDVKVMSELSKMLSAEVKELKVSVTEAVAMANKWEVEHSEIATELTLSNKALQKQITELDNKDIRIVELTVANASFSKKSALQNYEPWVKIESGILELLKPIGEVVNRLFRKG